MNSRWRATYPATLYLLLTLLVVILSWVLEIYGVESVIPSTGEVVKVQSPFSPEGIRWFLRNAVSNFTGFSPFGSVVVFMFGLGVALRSGFVESCLRLCLPHSGRHTSYVTVAVILLGLISNIVGDAGYVVLLPLAASCYAIAGLNPVAGLMTAHISASCGFSANIALSTMDSLLSRVTNEAATASALNHSATGTMSNYLFMALSTLVLLVAILAATRHAPLATTSASELPQHRKPLSHKERRSLFVSVFVGLLYAILIVLITFSSFGILRDASGGLQHSPFIIGILYIVALGFGLVGLTYGFMSGRFRSDRDVVGGLLHFASPLCNYLVIAFFASQMFALISYSNIDRILVASSAYTFSTLAIGPGTMLFCLLLFTAALNIVMASASSKWSIMAYILLPSLSAIGITPGEALCAFRIGDSLTNGITPLMPYIPMLLALMVHYKPDATYSTMLRYVWRPSLYIFVSWTALYFLWRLTGLSLGF